VGVVVYDAVVGGHLPPDHPDELFLGVGAVRSSPVDYGEVLGRDVRELLEEPGQQAIGGQRAGDVRDRDGYPVGGSNCLF
jgi:hypothetical protein